MGVCEMAKANGTDPEFLALKEVPCSELIQNAQIIMSGMIEISFLKELQDKPSPSRSLFEKPADKQVSAGPECVNGCTSSALWDCGYYCGSALTTCYWYPYSTSCLSKLYNCGKVAITSCCYCAAYYGYISCNYCS